VNLKIIPPIIRLYGNTAFRGKCPTENIEQVSIVNRIRHEYPNSWGLLIFHPRNEGLKERGQFSAVMKHNAEGMTKGAPDIIIPGSPPFICEIKRQNHMLSKIEDEQIRYLRVAAEKGAFACVALGALAAWEAFETWRDDIFETWRESL